MSGGDPAVDAHMAYRKAVGAVEEASGAWATFCDEVKSAGLQALEARRDLSNRDRQDGLRYLATLLADGIRAQLGPPLPDAPHVYRFIDELCPYGVPNADNTYLCSTLSDDREYRLSGNARGRDFIVTTGTGRYPVWDYAELREMHSRDIVTNEAGDFEIILSAEPREGDLLALDPGASILMIGTTTSTGTMNRAGFTSSSSTGRPGRILRMRSVRIFRAGCSGPRVSSVTPHSCGAAMWTVAAWRRRIPSPRSVSGRRELSTNWMPQR